MWAIIKFDKNNLEFLKTNIRKSLGNDVIFYFPKVLVQKYKNNKLTGKEFSLLGDYLFLFHEKLKSNETVNKLKFTKGLKYFLSGFKNYQDEINIFIKNCKTSENETGYLTTSFFQLSLNKEYKFTAGPFTEKIFKIISLQKNKINILLGNFKTSINKKEFSFSPIL